MSTFFYADPELTAWAAKTLPYAGFIGLQMGHDDEDRLLFALPFAEQNIGNVFLPALHGGLIGGFLESAAELLLCHQTGLREMPKIIDFSLDYLRSGKPQTCYARCTLTRQGSRIANLAIEGWQEQESKPIAVARIHLQMPGPAAL